MSLGKLVAIAAVSLLPLTAQGQPFPERRHGRTQRTLAWAAQELARAEGLASDCGNRRALVRALRRIRMQLNGLLDRVPPPPPPPPPGPEVDTPPAVQPMSPAAFGRLMESVNAQGLTKGKLAVISGAAGHNHFSCRQVRALIGAISFSRDKLRTLKMLARRITDRQSSFAILEAFDFQRDKEKARRILAR